MAASEEVEESGEMLRGDRKPAPFGVPARYQRWYRMHGTVRNGLGFGEPVGIPGEGGKVGEAKRIDLSFSVQEGIQR